MTGKLYMLVPVDSCQADRMLCYPQSPMCAPCAPCGPVCANITAEGMVDMGGNTNTKIWTNKNNSNYCDVPRSICGPNLCAPCAPGGPCGPVCANITAEGSVDACGNTNTKIWTNKLNGPGCPPAMCDPCAPMCAPACPPACPPVCGPGPPVRASITAEAAVDACGNTNTKIWVNKNNDAGGCFPCQDPGSPPACLPICPPKDCHQSTCGRRNGLDPTHAEMRGYVPRQHCPRNIPEKRVNRYKACVNRRDGMQDKCDPLTKKAFRNSCFKKTC